MLVPAVAEDPAADSIVGRLNVDAIPFLSCAARALESLADFITSSALLIGSIGFATGLLPPPPNPMTSSVPGREGDVTATTPPARRTNHIMAFFQDKSRLRRPDGIAATA